jgi:hypothetical protein
MVVLFASAGGCLAFAGFILFVNRTVTKSTERVFQEALPDAKSDDGYDHADRAFRKVYSKERFHEFKNANPNLFDSSRVEGIQVHNSRRDGAAYLVLIARVTDMGVVAYFCTATEDDKLALLGISGPGAALDKAVPEEIRHLAADVQP